MRLSLIPATLPSFLVLTGGKLVVFVMDDSATKKKLGRAKGKVAVEAVGLSKVFRLGFFARRVVALRNATFSVPKGATVGLVGPNGAGKTTTLKILMGLIKASKGYASIDGTPVPKLQSRGNLGYLPEHPHFYDHLRPGEYLVFAGQLCGLSRRECNRRSLELLEFVGLSSALKKPIRKFSKGMVQRLGIAQTLIHEPEIIILDEPQSGLDPIGRKEVKNMILDLRRKGRTVFFSSHILPDVEDVCDEIIVMINGSVRAEGTVESLLSRKILETEVEVAGLPDDAHDRFTELAIAGSRSERGSRFRFSGQLSEDLLKDIANMGATILELTPHREQLEDLFVREARTNNDQGAQNG